MKNILISVILLLSFYNINAQQNTHVSLIDIQKGEKWWGIFVSGAPQEPFDSYFKVNTAEVRDEGSYASMMLSSNGRYIWSDAPFEVEYNGRNIAITSQHEKVTVQKGGKNLREAYLVCCHKNFPPTGRIPNTDIFTLPIYETRYELGYAQGEEDIIKYASEILENGFAPGIIVIDEGWSSLTELLVPDKFLFPDPAAFVNRLHDMGFKVMITIKPELPLFGRVYTNAFREGMLVVGEDGRPVIGRNELYNYAIYDMSGSGFDDFRRSFERLHREFPADGFRFDARNAMNIIGEGEADIDTFVSNWLSLGKDIPLAEYFPAMKGLSAQIVAIEVEKGVSVINVDELINNILSTSLAGYHYASATMSIDTTELYGDDMLMKQIIQFEMMMPVSHINFAPWRIQDERLRTAVVESMSFRYGLKGYINELVEESARTAEPLLRHLEYQYPKTGFSDCRDQFMLGSKYMFAPVAEGVTRRLVRLPKGTWTDRNGKRIKGPMVFEADCSDGGILYYQLQK